VKVAITGGTGFIGRHLVGRLLIEGHDVRILSRRRNGGRPAAIDQSRAEYFVADLMQQESLKGFLNGVDVLFHCAGQLTNTVMMRDVHIDGTRNLIEAADGKISRWVQLSSIGVYGAVFDQIINEGSVLNPLGEYEITKLESDGLVLSAANQDKFSVSILRPSNVFGSDMSNQSLFSMTKVIERGMFFFVGRPGASANYVHVDNVVEGLLRCGSMDEANGNIYNLSDYCTIEGFVELIANALDRRAPTKRLPEAVMRWLARLMEGIPGFPLTEARVDALTNRTLYPIDRIREELGYKHVISMQEGVQQLVAAYNDRQEHSS